MKFPTFTIFFIFWVYSDSIDMVATDNLQRSFAWMAQVSIALSLGFAPIFALS